MSTQGRRRAYGQHFLKDRALAQKIAEKAVSEVTALGCKILLEIGPGHGALTLPLIELLKGQRTITKLILCEKDRYIAAEWREKCGAINDVTLEIHEADFLELKEEKWLKEQPIGVVSNLPYSTGTAIATRLAAHHKDIPVMVLMFQAEVARRLYAEPSTKDMGSLSLWMQNRWDIAKMASVPPGAFSPPPEVMSEVVVCRARKEPRIVIPENGEQLWENLLRAAFAHRRKMLRSGLGSDPKWRNALELSGVDGTKRAEALDWNEWECIFSAGLKTM
jgi:16S rRNA (adenine1518-N6/adenine1519-N6)-dimethyltransferase